jgi:hypothetical protein
MLSPQPARFFGLLMALLPVLARADWSIGSLPSSIEA